MYARARAEDSHFGRENITSLCPQPYLLLLVLVVPNRLTTRGYIPRPECSYRRFESPRCPFPNTWSEYHRRTLAREFWGNWQGINCRRRKREAKAEGWRKVGALKFIKIKDFIRSNSGAAYSVVFASYFRNKKSEVEERLYIFLA